MSFTDAVKSVFSNYANFNGRARRKEYWYFVLFNILVNIVLSILTFAVPVLSILSFIYSLAVLIPGLALCWRRLHDLGKSGAYFFFVLIPLVGAIILFAWFCMDGQQGPNAYGPSPKYNNYGGGMYNNSGMYY